MRLAYWFYLERKYLASYTGRKGVRKGFSCSWKPGFERGFSFQTPFRTWTPFLPRLSSYMKHLPNPSLSPCATEENLEMHIPRLLTRPGRTQRSQRYSLELCHTQRSWPSSTQCVLWTVRTSGISSSSPYKANTSSFFCILKVRPFFKVLCVHTRK